MRPVQVFRLALFFFAYFAHVGAFAPYFSLYLQSLGTSAMDIGVLLSVAQVMRIFAPNLWAGVADRSGARLVLLRVALGAGAVAWCGVFVTQSFWGLFATLALVAFFTSAALPLFETLLFAQLRDDLGRYALMRVWGSVGFIVAVLGVGAILDAQPVQVLTPLVLAPLLAAFALACSLRDTAVEAEHGAHLPVWSLLRRPEVAALLGACFLMSVAHGPLYTFYSIYLADHGYSKTTVGVLWSLGVVAEIAVFLLAPRIFMRWSPGAVLVFSFGCAVVRFAAIGWGVGSLPILVVAQLLHGATFGSYHAAAFGQINQWFPAGQRSRGQALYMSLSFGAGGMVGGTGAGFAWDRIGPAWTFAAASVCAALGLILAVATATMTSRSRRRL
jgi:MFS transporter, PPP family, 3-phenylpropionic acid transporter